MPKMTVATDKFPYGKNVYRRGSEVDIEDRHVELFLKIGKVRWPEGATPNASDLPEEVMQRNSRREPVTEVEEPAVEEVAEIEDEPVVEKAMKAEAVEDEAPKPQTYLRRDMVAATPKAKPAPKPGRRGKAKKSRS